MPVYQFNFKNESKVTDGTSNEIILSYPLIYTLRWIMEAGTDLHVILPKVNKIT